MRPVTTQCFIKVSHFMVELRKRLSQALAHTALLGKLLRWPLSLLPDNIPLPILTGPLLGTKWILHSSIYACWFGTYEHQKQNSIAKMVEPGTVFYDIGSNVGFYTLLASALVGERGKVFSFEPLPSNLLFLHRHLALNCTENVIVVEAAVSDASGQARFANGPRGEMAHISPTGSLLVQTVSLDNLFIHGNILPPNYIKIDAEGAELQILQGSRIVIERTRPVIFLATHGHHLAAACLKYLNGFGYQIGIIDGLENEYIAFPGGM